MALMDILMHPPFLPRFHDEEKDHKVRLLHGLAMATMICLLILVSQRVIAGVLPDFIPLLVFPFTFIVALWLTRTGYLEAAGGVILWTVLVFVDLLMWKNDGIRGGESIALLGILVGAGFILGKRHFQLFIGATLVSVFVVGMLEVNDQIHYARSGKTTPIDVVDFLVALAVSAFAIRVFSSDLFESLARARQSDAESRNQAERLTRSEERLRESERQFRTLFENAVLGIYRTSPDGRILMANPALCEMLGYSTANELMEHNTERERFHPDYSKEEFRSELELTDKVIRRETSWNTATGGTIFVREHARAIRDAAGRVISYEGTVENLTEQKRMEDLVKESEEYYRTLVDASPDAIVITNPNGRLSFISPKSYDVFGMPDDREILGKSILEWVAPEAREQAMKRFRMVVTGEVSGELREYHLLRSDRTPFWAEIQSVRLTNARGEVRGLLLVCRDVTERKKMEQELQVSEKRYRRLVEFCPDAIVVHSLGTVVFANPAALELIGATDASQMLGRPMQDYIHPDYRGQNADRMAEAAQSGEPLALTEEKYIRIDGEVIDVEVASMPIQFQGKPAMQIIGRDITARKKMESERQLLHEQTQRDAEAKAELLEEVNHRVKNNLMAILGLLLAEQESVSVSGNPVAEESIHNIARRIESLLKVHQMLSDSEWAPMPFVDLADSIIEGIALAVSDDQKVVIEIDPSHVTVSPRQANNLALVFTELATNSLKYALPGRKSVRIRVQANELDDLLRVEYRDDGPGYPRDVLEMKRQNVGLRLIRQLVEANLLGTLSLRNQNGAAAGLVIKMEDRTST